MTWTCPSTVEAVKLRALAVVVLAVGAVIAALVLRGNSNTNVGTGTRPPGAAPAARPRGYSGPTTFFVAPNGSDGNPGTTPARPWRTVGRVDRASLVPGDRVLFEGGQTFSDNTLMPGDGYLASGTAAAPIVFGTYGSGKARLTWGVWLGHDGTHPYGPSHLTFTNLALGPEQGFQGTGSYIKLTSLDISHLSSASHSELGIQTEGSHWTIVGNRIADIGGSGMLLGFDADAPGDPAGGDHYVVSYNTIINTGGDRGIGYPTHGIYLKVADALVSHNWIVNFSADGVSARYRDATITDNYIAHGSIGVAWYQYDSRRGTTRVIHNTITGTSEAAIFVCGVREGCVQPIERFVVKANVLHEARGARMNLQPTIGGYVL